MQAKLTNQEWKVYLDTRDSKNYQVARAAWIGDYLDPSDFMEQYLSDAGDSNFIRLQQQGVRRAACAQAQTEVDPTNRMKMFAEGRGDLPQRPAADPDLSLRAQADDQQEGRRLVRQPPGLQPRSLSHEVLNPRSQDEARPAVRSPPCAEQRTAGWRTGASRQQDLIHACSALPSSGCSAPSRRCC